MSKQLGYIKLKQYADNSAFVEFSTKDNFDRITLFAFYIDRVIHNLPDQKIDYLVKVIETTTSNFFIKYLKNGKPTGKRKVDLIEQLLSESDFGMKLTNNSSKNPVFEVNAEYFEKSGEYYMQTSFKPLFVKNEKIENNAMGSFTYLFDSIIRFITDNGAEFLMIMLANMAGLYKEHGKKQPLGLVPRTALEDTASRFA